MTRLIPRRIAVAGLAALLWPGPAGAAEIRVISSGGFAAAYRALVPGFEQATGNTVSTGWEPSMGKTVDAVPARLARQEPIDVPIMAGCALVAHLASPAAAAAIRDGGMDPMIAPR